MIGEFFFANANEGVDSRKEKIAFSSKNFRFFTDQKIFETENLVIKITGEITKTFDDENNNSLSDEEIIEKYYSKYNENFVEKLDGIFTIVIFDKTKNEVSIYNNRYTCHGLYYYLDDDKFVFSNKLTNIIKYHLENPEPHMGSILSFISNGFTMSEQTQVKGIKKLLPTFSLIVDQKKSKLNNHWNKEITFERKKFENVEDKVDEYIDIYQNGIKNYLKKTNPKKIGTLLSGGHDTSFVVANLSRVTNTPIHAYTITFPGWVWCEEKFAKNISEKFGATFHPIPFGESHLDEIINTIKANEEPVMGAALPLYVLAKEAKKDGIDVLFGGDGGDTLWGEYYPVAEVHRYIKNMPLIFRKIIHKISYCLLKVFDWERFWELEHVTRLFAEENYYKNFMYNLCTYRHFNKDQRNLILSHDIFKSIQPPENALTIEFTKENFADALIEGKLFNAFYTYQSFNTYKSVEDNGIKLFLPTIQKDVIKFITDLPYNWVNGGTTFHRLTNAKSINRRLHKKALARFLRQSEIYNRSFDIPWFKILKARPEVLSLLKERLKKRGWYNNDGLDRLFEEFKKQKVKDHELMELENHGFRILTLLSLEIWAIEILDKRFLVNNFEQTTLEEYLKIC